MKLNNLKLTILTSLFVPLFVGAQEFTLDFSQPSVDCVNATVCYDATLAANGANFGLGNYNPRFFYDASRITYVLNSANVMDLPVGYSLNPTGFDLSVGDLSGQNPFGEEFGTLPFDASLAYLEFGVDYVASTPPVPQVITGVATNVLQNICFEIVDGSILSDPASCFDLIWATDQTLENYANGPTTLQDDSQETADLLTSTYIDLTSASNCLVGACDMPTDPLPVYELDFTNGELDCDAQEICYDITIEAPVDFDLGSYNLRIFYDGDILDLIDASPNLSPGSLLGTSYSIGVIDDMQGGDMSANGSLPFDDNLDVIDVGVNFITGSTSITATSTPTIILHDLCFDIVDPALIDDPAVCIHAVWVTNATEENYLDAETTVNVAGGIGITTDIDNSIYNDLDPTGDQCLIGACTDPAIPTMGEWGLICLALILLIFGIVAIKETNTSLKRGAATK